MVAEGAFEETVEAECRRSGVVLLGRLEEVLEPVEQPQISESSG